MASFVESDDEDANILAIFNDSSSESDFEGFDIDDIPINLNDRPIFDIDQCERDRENRQDIEYGWCCEDAPNVCAPFTGNPGLKINLPDDPSELDFFNSMFEESMWTKLVLETNKYADSRISNQNLTRHSRLGKWSPVSIDEMKVFISLVIAMGLVRKPDVVDYWSNDLTCRTPFFGDHMTRDRFLNILSNLHLVDNTEPLLHADRLHKIRPFVDMLRNNFLNYEPDQKLSLDEATCPFKGKISFRVYNPAKPNRFGMKLYQICESSSGYCLFFDIYDGTEGCALYSQLADVNPESAQTTKIVVGLLARSGLLNKGHTVYLDNYYNSPELAEELDSHDTYICGTVRSNRRNLPKSFSELKLKAGETVFRKKNNMLAIKFHEKRDVHMLTTYHQATYTILERRDRRSGEPIVKSTAVVDYCKNMGGVDLSDQMMQYYEALRRSVKWWRKMFFHLLNLLVLNCYRLYLKYGTPRVARRTHQKFRSALVRGLLESANNAPKPQGSRGRKPEPLDRLTGSHYPIFIPAKEGAKKKHPQRDCVACNPTVKQRVGHKRRQSIYMCDKCEKALCVPNCFKVYHTHKHYKTILNGDAGDASSIDSD